MPIECQFDADQSLLTCTVTGELTFGQVIDLQDEYFEKYLAKSVILDLRLASFKKLKTKDIETIAQMSDMGKDLRPANSKTAIVANSPVAYGLGLMYSIHSEFKELTWEADVFKSMDEALDWIGPGDAFHPGQVQKGVA